MTTLSETVLSGGTPEEIERAPVPREYLAAHLSVADTDMFRGVRDKDVRKSLRVGYVPTPELAPDEVLVAVLASSINYNTVWSAMFEPIPTFRFLKQFARQGGWAARHDQPHHVLGSDAAGVVVRKGSGVRRWNVGDHVVVHPVQVDDQEPATHADGMMGQEQRAWGFETNFGALAEYTVVRASQLLPKPAHLTWEEAAVNPLCAGTAYRMLVSDRGARLKQGDVVLVWGAAGGLGGYAVQFARNGGAIPVGVVGSAEKAAAVRRLGCDIVIEREEIGLDGDPSDDPDRVIAIGKRLGGIIRERTGRDANIVFEHVGRATFGISLFVAARGGTVITCGSSTGYQHVYDNRYLWMRLKRVIGSHAANLQEQAECGELISSGRIAPTISRVFPLAETGEAARLVQTNGHLGKVAVLCQAPRAGLGVTDQRLRDELGPDRVAPWLAAAGTGR
ncbi:crotonyl-CoA carboxylase/reductase [Streptomyces sp. DSM 44915]|uniref:Crotonyl-CoA carboxylase/reductase n=1 Tax=Streptomyces chisholmiae TaxID=3075540 RepID=A0ABU2K0T2_9ACTN|nr:crotonyl-CoA carboxylase/reductase [Streptomyces sp. DSM 44915]MDT0270827.1 crotonyl-CoA carboxylase/reductase [Streptomyces sp. DSM 44915]